MPGCLPAGLHLPTQACPRMACNLSRFRFYLAQGGASLQTCRVEWHWYRSTEKMACSWCGTRRVQHRCSPVFCLQFKICSWVAPLQYVLERGISHPCGPFQSVSASARVWKCGLVRSQLRTPRSEVCAEAHWDVCMAPQSSKETEKNPHLLDIGSRSPMYI